MERNCEKCREVLKPSNIDKWRFSFIGALIVIFIFNPITFNITQNIFRKVLNKSGCPTIFGYILHTIVYLLLVRLSMES
jgi:hypothetical protein